MTLRASVIGLAVVVMLAGCGETPEPVPTLTSPTPTPTVVVQPTPPIGPVGSGTLAGVPFTVEWDGTNFAVFGLSALDLARGVFIYFTIDPVAEGDCSDGYFLAFDLVGVPAEIGLPIDGASTSADPTFIHGISQVFQEEVYDGGCFMPIVAASTITWTMAPLYPDLVVTDSGDTGGARGVVTLDGTTPVSYLVHQGDVWEEIAARFGITGVQLDWLNPRRHTALSEAIKEETLNLSPSRR